MLVVLGFEEGVRLVAFHNLSLAGHVFETTIKYDVNNQNFRLGTVI